MSTRRSVQFIFQNHKPTAKDIISLLHSHFGNIKIDSNRLIIVHCDSAGENTALEVLEYCAQNNINLSVSETGYGNQVAESHNRSFWLEVGSLTLFKYKKKIDYNNVNFCDLMFEDKYTIVTAAVINLNYRCKPRSPALPMDSTPNEMEKAQVLFPYNSTKTILAKNNTEKGKSVKKIRKVQLLSYRAFNKERSLETRLNMALGIARTPSEFIYANPVADIDNDQINRYYSDTNIIYNTLEKIDELSTKKNGVEKVKVFLKKWIESEEAKLLSNYQKIILCLNISNLEKTEQTRLNTERIIKQNEELKEHLLELSLRNKKQEEKFEELKTLHNVKISKRKVKENLAKKKKTVKKQVVRKAIYPDDFPIILKLADSKVKFVRHRNRIAHCVLKITGIRVGNLIWVGIPQLREIYNYGTFTLKIIKTRSYIDIIIPITKSMELYIEETRHDWEELQKILKQKGFDLNEIVDINDPKPSVLWGGKHGIKRETFTRQLNAHLREASQILQKYIRSHSYRKGVAEVMGQIDGIATQAIMGHKDFSTTARYMKRQPSKKRTKQIIEEVHNIKNADDLDDKYPFSKK